MNFVIDANIAISMVMGRPENKTIDKYLKESELILVPELFVYEVSNVFWKYYKGYKMPLTKFKRALAEAMEIPDDFISGTGLYLSALNLATQLNHSAYDMFYLALAIQEDAVLLTLDKQLKECAIKLGLLAPAV